MQKLKELEQKENQIFVNAWQNGFFYPTEFDQELNDIQREKIKVYKKKWGRAYGVRINEGKPMEMIRGKAKNFSFDAIVPVRNKKLIELILEYRKADIKESYNLIDKIVSLVEKLGGDILHWV